MGRGSFRGGSTLLRIWPASRSKPRRTGLLQREFAFAKHGVEPEDALLSSKQKPPKAGRKAVPKSMPTAPVNAVQASASPPTETATEALSTKNSAKQSANYAQVLGYLNKHHDRCPKIVRKRIAQIAGEGRWKERSTDRLAARSAEHYVITDVCGVLRLVECGIDASTANRLIAAQRNAVLTLWGF